VAFGSLSRRAALRTAGALAIGLPLAGCDSAAGTWQGSAPPSAAEPSGAAGSAGSTSPTTVPMPPEVTHGRTDRPMVALTFHGQGEVAQAKALLSELEHEGARATVLAVGSWLAAQPAMAKRILDGGHELGNHTQNHAALTHLDAAAVHREIDACAQVLRELTGSIGTWFRPSQTQFSTPTIRAQAARVGYRTCLSYDLDSLDYTDPGPAAVIRNVTTAVGNGSIVSLHFGHPGTVAAIPPILAALSGRGLRAVTMTELIGA
jgi:peptidoglycan/xylan/chitin deacetylase (PgdA/CDA1 family)